MAAGAHQKYTVIPLGYEWSRAAHRSLPKTFLGCAAFVWGVFAVLGEGFAVSMPYQLAHCKTEILRRGFPAACQLSVVGRLLYKYGGMSKTDCNQVQLNVRQQYRMYAECRLSQAFQQKVCQLQKHMHEL